MGKTAMMALRVEPRVKKAVDAAANADERSVAQYVERILLAHLRAAGKFTD